MRALFINAVCGIGSTGRICTDTAKELEAQGHEVKIAYGRGNVPAQFEKYAIRIGGTIDVYWHALMKRCFDQRGYWSKRATRRFLEWADTYDPDLLWLHNIHDYFINFEMLFEWIKSRPGMKVKWTQHDCWAFTGGCMHFCLMDCYQWREGCMRCPSGARRVFRHMEQEKFLRKKVAFTGVSDMTIVAVSHWIGNLVSESFLKEYPIEVCHNEIDRNIFKPTYGDFKSRYGLEKKKIILGVSGVWSKRKGSDDFFALSRIIDDDYVVVMVGLKKKQLRDLPDNIIGISHTNSAVELAEIYTAADVFINLTYEDNYPTVNLEAQACGTPCITYRTGGSPESVPPENVVEQGDLTGIINRINEICDTKQVAL